MLSCCRRYNSMGEKTSNKQFSNLVTLTANQAQICVTIGLILESKHTGKVHLVEEEKSKNVYVLKVELALLVCKLVAWVHLVVVAYAYCTKSGSFFHFFLPR